MSPRGAEEKLTASRAEGGTNRQIDLANPDNLGGQSTDNGNVPNFKYSFSNSRTRLLKGGWVREQVVTDLPQSHDIAGAQMHLKKGAMREMHWHKVVSCGSPSGPFRRRQWGGEMMDIADGQRWRKAEWGIVYK